MDKIDKGRALDNDSGEISLKEFILKLVAWGRYVLSKWTFIAILSFLGAVGGGIYFYVTPPQYRAELTFVYGESSGSSQMGGLSSLASQFGLGGLGSSNSVFDGQNLIEFMQSRKIIQKVLISKVLYAGKKTSLADLYIDIYKYRKLWHDKHSKLETVSFDNVDGSKPLSLNQNIALGGIYGKIRSKNLVVGKKDKESNIMAMSFLSENELLSQYFVEILSQEVSKYYIETKTKKAAENVATLQRQTDSVRRALGNAIKGVAAFTDVNPNPNPSLHTLLVPSQNKQVDVQGNQAIYSIMVQNLEIAKISLRNETPLIQVIDEPTLPLDVQKISLLTALIIGAFLGFIIMVVFMSAKFFLKNIFN